ncbi:MAG TPA: lysylphosphatidylglycerol synthase transmembrane domain-containing protein [Blastocatellia bacterium]|nr:lysylphosphatidylglycerol synthase transmembrane domain-containing protein [Blastocatellia bacterium]
MTKQLKQILILAVGVGLIYWFVNRLDWATVGEYLRHAKLWPLLLAAVLINLTIFVRSLRWQVFLAPIAQVRLSNLIAATAVGFGGLFVIGRAAEIIRPTVLSLRERLQPSATFATILIERIFDTVTVVTLFAICLLFSTLPPEQAIFWQKVGGTKMLGLIFLIGISVGLVVLVFLKLKAKTVMPWLAAKSTRLPKKLAQLLLNFVGHLADGLGILLDLKKLFIAVLYTIVVWSLIASATWLTLYAFGLSFPLMRIIFILGFGLVGSIVPTPGGSAGAFHAAAAKALEFLGVESNLAASVAIVYHLIAFGPPFVLGLYYLIRHDISFNQLRDMIASEGEKSTLTQKQAES